MGFYVLSDTKAARREDDRRRRSSSSRQKEGKLYRSLRQSSV